MNNFRIKLNSADQVIRFVAICGKFDDDITVYNGSIQIDGKSLLGMMSVDNRRNFNVRIDTSDCELIAKFKNDMYEFIVKEA